MRNKIADVGTKSFLIARDTLAAFGLVWFVRLCRAPRWQTFAALLITAAVAYGFYRIRRAVTPAGQGVSARNAAPRRKPAPAPHCEGLPKLDPGARGRVVSVRFVPPPDLPDVQSALVNLGYTSRDARAAAMEAAKAGKQDFERMFSRAIAQLREARA